MGGGTSTPGYVDPNEILFGTQGGSFMMPGGGRYNVAGKEGLFNKELYAQFLNQAKTGMDAKQRAMIEGSAAGSLRSGEQNQREMFASMGNAPISAQVGAQTNLRSGINKNLLEALYTGDINAKQTGIGNIMSTLGLGMSGADSRNTFNMNKYNIDKQNEFSWGDALGSVLGMGGQLGGAAISKGAK